MEDYYKGTPPTCYECKLYNICSSPACKKPTKRDPFPKCTNSIVIELFRNTHNNNVDDYHAGVAYRDPLDVIDMQDWSDCYNDLESEYFMGFWGLGLPGYLGNERQRSGIRNLDIDDDCAICESDSEGDESDGELP